MRLLYVSSFQFVENDDGMYALPAYGNGFWTKYLDVFDGIDVLGENIKKHRIHRQ